MSPLPGVGLSQHLQPALRMPKLDCGVFLQLVLLWGPKTSGHTLS